ncbi:hypothetical protein I7I53_07096 [Histoplasma capsulatum var. duboisii H88]|uniref:Uncharacterized protein n=1 Tax=Ajellomyces capsulatus (strain H88) TaxID=544711 RepID=A0A8A1LIB1_AJEC8|nr:hypothetical protein I7I53_07096 [Histoplasma capsulatum var. duboisii H88]
MRRQCLTKPTSQPSSQSQIVFPLLSLPYIVVSPGMDCVYNISLHLPHLVRDQLRPFPPRPVSRRKKMDRIRNKYTGRTLSLHGALYAGDVAVAGLDSRAEKPNLYDRLSD